MIGISRWNVLYKPGSKKCIYVRKRGPRSACQYTYTCEIGSFFEKLFAGMPKFWHRLAFYMGDHMVTRFLLLKWLWNHIRNSKDHSIWASWTYRLHLTVRLSQSLWSVMLCQLKWLSKLYITVKYAQSKCVSVEID